MCAGESHVGLCVSPDGDDVFVDMQGGLPVKKPVKLSLFAGSRITHLASLCFWVSLFSMEVTSSTGSLGENFALH